ncbi:uracil-DNA glycosylase family protein [Caballeronia telluris]|uniref:Uracil DNA glycosylase superfamily protein n=1 Tax=Caballeronia telluris TaxID=326475 RepID=A0A158KJ46_9BURK|nr:hypothetical protein [Caballeronia telluris]SAL81176.1 hypothetical protein AWB66_06385 [Caballeronia telluris]
MSDALHHLPSREIDARQGRPAPCSFEVDLRDHCDTPAGVPYLRPFSRNRNWKTASVFIIGDNPSTPLRNEFDDFDDYWTALTQNIEKFDDAYKSKRLDGKATRTTLNTKKLSNLIGPEHCLVTNTCWVPTPESDTISAPERRRDQAQLKKLIGFCRPKVLFVYGSKAIEFANKAYNLTLDPYVPPAEQDYTAEGMRVFAFPHLSGLGIKAGKTFQPDTDLPVFAQRIKNCLS